MFLFIFIFIFILVLEIRKLFLFWSTNRAINNHDAHNKDVLCLLCSVCAIMWKNVLHECQGLFPVVRHYSRIAPPRPASAAPVIRVSNNVAQLGSPKEGPKPRQLLSLPPFPAHPLPGKSLVNLSGLPTHVTAISWIKYYFDEIPGSVVQSHFNKGLVSIRHYFFLDDGISIFSSVFFFFCWYEYTTWYDQCQFSAFCWADCSCSINHVCTIT